MDDLEELVDRGEGVNFIPCVKWVQRGVAKTMPEKVKLTQEELSAVIEKTQKELDVTEKEENDEEEENEGEEVIEEQDDQDIVQKYGLDNYDDENDEEDKGDLANLISHANPRDDPYLVNPDMDDDLSDIEDYTIKDSDNLLLVGHVDGNAAVLEVYGRLKSFAFPEHTGAKIHNLSKNSHFENLTIHKIRIFKISFFTKFTFSKFHFFTKFTFLKSHFTIS